MSLYTSDNIPAFPIPDSTVTLTVGQSAKGQESNELPHSYRFQSTEGSWWLLWKKKYRFMIKSERPFFAGLYGPDVSVIDGKTNGVMRMPSQGKSTIVNMTRTIKAGTWYVEVWLDSLPSSYTIGIFEA